MQTYTSETQRYSLQYPDHWESEIDENTVTFFDTEDGVGAFLVTEYEFEDGANLDLSKQLTELICDFHDMDADTIVAGIQKDELKAWTSFETDDTYWQYWLYAKDQCVLFITYNCEIADKKIEEEQVKQIADSINFK
jgi:hypothetical protein